MKKSFLILISLFIFVVGISCASAASLDADDNVVADEGPALLGNGLGGGLGGGLGSGINGGFSGGIGSSNLNTVVNPEVPLQ